jgi:acyl-homoserine-lactone acylase
MTTLLRVLVLALSIAALPVGAQASSASFPSSADEARWRSEAQDATIVRDDWGIAHIHGKTDADAVFGMLFTQAEGESATASTPTAL